MAEIHELGHYRRPLKSDGDGGNYGGMEARVAKLEADVANISSNMGELKQDVRELRTDARNDFRVLFAALITATLGLAALMSKGFGWL